MSKKIFYINLKNPTEKVRFLVKIAQDHYQKNKKLLILTADTKTTEYVDNLLWAEPKEGFLPHFASQTHLDECIVISAEKTNLNQAKTVLNLTPEPIDPIALKLNSIIEIEDSSTSAKIQVFKKKLSYYQKANIPIVAIS